MAIRVKRHENVSKQATLLNGLDVSPLKWRVCGCGLNGFVHEGMNHISNVEVHLNTRSGNVNITSCPVVLPTPYDTTTAVECGKITYSSIMPRSHIHGLDAGLATDTIRHHSWHSGLVRNSPYCIRIASVVVLNHTYIVHPYRTTDTGISWAIREI